MKATAPRPRRPRTRKSQHLRHRPFTLSPRLASGPGAAANIRPDGGPRAHPAAVRVAAPLQERIPQLLLPRPPGDPGDRLSPGDRGGRVDRGDQGLERLADAPHLARRRRLLDPHRVLAASPDLPLGARQRLRPADALHHPRHPPRSSQRQDAAGDAAVGLDPAGGALLPRLPPRPRRRRISGFRRLHARLSRLRLHALLRPPLRAEEEGRQAAPRGTHAPPLPGPPLRPRRLLAALGRRLPHPAEEAQPLALRSAARAGREKRDQPVPAVRAGEETARHTSLRSSGRLQVDGPKTRDIDEFSAHQHLLLALSSHLSHASVPEPAPLSRIPRSSTHRPRRQPAARWPLTAGTTMRWSSGPGRRIITSAGARSISQTRSSPERPWVPVAPAETTTRSNSSSASRRARACR